MVAALAMATRCEPLSLRRTLDEDGRLFDSLWYAAFPPQHWPDTDQETDDGETVDIDALLGR